MIPLIFFVAFLNVGKSAVYDYKYNTLRKFESETVCNYEPAYLNELNFDLYYCVVKDQCLDAETWSPTRNLQFGREPLIPLDTCLGTFENGDRYVCCHPADIKNFQSNNPNKTLSRPTKWANGVRSYLKCLDYSGLTCLDREHCPKPSRRAHIPYVKGGTPTTITKYPHLALIGESPRVVPRGNWFCLGSIISKYYVLTAATCREDENGYEPTHVRVGETAVCFDLWQHCPHNNIQTIEIETKIFHPKARLAYYFHDILLLKLLNYILFNKYVRPACLEGWFTPVPTNFTPTNITPKNMTNMTSNVGRVMFAMYQENSALPGQEILNSTYEMELRVHDEMSCNKHYENDIRMGGNRFDYSIQFCAGNVDIQPTQVPCLNDFGGPLQRMNYQPDCMWVVMGVMAYSRNYRCRGLKPPVFTRVSAYIQWIEDTVWPNFDFNIFQEVDTTFYECAKAEVEVTTTVAPLAWYERQGRC